MVVGEILFLINETFNRIYIHEREYLKSKVISIKSKVIEQKRNAVQC